ncbi:MAG: hypothetical protein ABIT09_09885 [Croceibacterium sp.]
MIVPQFLLVSALLFVSAPVEQADRANGALTGCLFATARAAHTRAETAAQFHGTLDRSCLSEEATARRAAVQILVKRGATRAEAEQTIDDTLRTGREAVIRAYSIGRPAGDRQRAARAG